MTTHQLRVTQVDAFLWLPGETMKPHFPAWVVEAITTPLDGTVGAIFRYGDTLHVRTPHGTAIARARDWVVRQPSGELYVWPEHLFNAAYGPVGTTVAIDHQVMRQTAYREGWNAREAQGDWPSPTQHTSATLAALGLSLAFIEVWLDGVDVTRARIVSFDEEAGFITRYRANADGTPVVVDERFQEERIIGEVKVYLTWNGQRWPHSPPAPAEVGQKVRLRSMLRGW